MKQLRDRYDIEDENPEAEDLKHLPDTFEDKDDEFSMGKSILLSTILHPVTVALAWLIVTLLTLWGIFPDLFNKPAMKPKDIEFVLTTKEAQPINKNTKYRSDKNSRAGGEHDPTRKVSEPSPAPAPKVAPSPAPQKQPAKQPQKQPVQQQPQKQPVQQTKPTPSVAPKPSVTPPTARPSTESPRPAMPKLSSNPKSPFSIETPKSTGPIGPSPSSGTGTSSGSSGGSTSSGTSSGMPSPQFSASRGGSTSGSGSSGSQGSYGSGNLGNPSPGNRAGSPGIDALKQPNWGAYMAEVERRVKRNWTPPKGDESKRVVVLFKIGRDGRLLSIKVTKSSGQPLADQAAKAAIELSAPFRPLPPEYKDSSIDIDFTFDYNVVGAKYR